MMGADGRLHIWPEAKLATEWPSHPELFAKIEAQHFNVYRNELGGIAYWHIYQHSGLRDWSEICQDDEWNVRQPMNEAQLMDFLKLREFVRWLQANATVWEVWT